MDKKVTFYEPLSSWAQNFGGLKPFLFISSKNYDKYALCIDLTPFPTMGELQPPPLTLTSKSKQLTNSE